MAKDKLPDKINPDAITYEAKTMIALAAEGIGGLAKLTAFARTHQESFWTKMYTKLLPMQVTATQVNVNVGNDEAAQANLEQVLERVVAQRVQIKLDEQNGIPGPFVGMGGPDIDARIRAHACSHTVIIDNQPNEQPQVQAPQSAAATNTSDATRTAATDKVSEGAASNIKKAASAINVSRAPPTSSIPGLAAGAALDGADDTLSTTAKFYAWNGRSGRGSMP